MPSNSPSQMKLREFVLTDEQLLDAEEQFPGIIRLSMATRNKARVLVEGSAWDFSMDESRAENPILQLTVRRWNRDGAVPPLLRDFVYHRAAEAILAARVGHEEHRRHMKERREREHLQTMPRDGMASAAQKR